MRTPKPQIWTREDAERLHRGHWFDRGALRFFGTRFGAEFRSGAGVVYFVTSECSPSGVRRWSVRQACVVSARSTGRGTRGWDCDIKTVGEFHSYASRAAANRAAKTYAAAL